MFRKDYSWRRKRLETHARRAVGHAHKFHIRYGNLVLIVLGVMAGVWIAYNPDALLFLTQDESMSYASAFLMGVMYPLGITTPAAIVGFFVLADTMDPVALSLVGASGALVTNFAIFYFIRHRLLDHLHSFTKRFGVSIHVMGHMVRKHKTLKHVIPMVAGIIIATPLPTEIAIGIFAAIKFEMKKFLLYAFLFSIVSIYIVSQFGHVF